MGECVCRRCCYGLLLQSLPMNAQSLLSKFNIQSMSRPKHELKLHTRETFITAQDA